MDEGTRHQLVNRDEVLPVISVSGNGGTSSDAGDIKRDRLRQSLSPTKLKGKLHDATATATATAKDNEFSVSLQDRLFSK